MATEILYKYLGPTAFLLSLVVGVIGGRRTPNNPHSKSNPNLGGITHTILEGEAASIRGKQIGEWDAKDTNIVTYAMLAVPIKDLNNTLHLLNWLLGSAGIGTGLMMILDRFFIP